MTLAEGTVRHDVTPVLTRASQECHERAGCLDDFKQDVDAYPVTKDKEHVQQPSDPGTLTQQRPRWTLRMRRIQGD